MNNESNGKRRWGDWTFRAVMAALVASIFGLQVDTNRITHDTNTHSARMEEKITAHIDFHPDTGLTKRIDELVAENERLRRRVRWLEIRTGGGQQKEQ